MKVKLAFGKKSGLFLHSGFKKNREKKKDFGKERNYLRPQRIKVKSLKQKDILWKI